MGVEWGPGTSVWKRSPGDCDVHSLLISIGLDYGGQKKGKSSRFSDKFDMRMNQLRFFGSFQNFHLINLGMGPKLLLVPMLLLFLIPQSTLMRSQS